MSSDELIKLIDEESRDEPCFFTTFQSHFMTHLTFISVHEDYSNESEQVVIVVLAEHPWSHKASRLIYINEKEIKKWDGCYCLLNVSESRESDIHNFCWLTSWLAGFVLACIFLNSLKYKNLFSLSCSLDEGELNSITMRAWEHAKERERQA